MRDMKIRIAIESTLSDGQLRRSPRFSFSLQRALGREGKTFRISNFINVKVTPAESFAGKIAFTQFARSRAANEHYSDIRTNRSSKFARNLPRTFRSRWKIDAMMMMIPISDDDSRFCTINKNFTRPIGNYR